LPTYFTAWANKEDFIFNTTIQENGFYLELRGQKTTLGQYQRLHFLEVEGMWRHMYNAALDLLIIAKVLDPYGRAMYGPEETLQRMRTFCQKNYDPLQENDQEDPQHYGSMTMTELLIDQLADGGNVDMAAPDWIKIYPRSLVTLPLRTIGEQMESHSMRLSFMRRLTRDAALEIPLQWLRADLKDISIFYDTTLRRNIMEIRMSNQFHNDVTLVLQSNTNRTDRFLEDMATFLEGDVEIMVGRCKKLDEEHKLLLTITTHTRKDETNDHTGTGKVFPQED
jgi:hypothetical protein